MGTRPSPCDMPSCLHCQIELVDGTTDSNKCSLYSGYPYIGLYDTHCCNCAKEKLGWPFYDESACRQCKTRAAQKAPAVKAAADIAAREKAAAEKAVTKRTAAEKAAARGKGGKRPWCWCLGRLRGGG